MTRSGIAQLTLSHFRSHRRTELAFDGRPVAIFGPNGAGKTNILEAVSLLSPGRGMRRAPIAELARKPEALGWKITASVGGHDIATFAEGDAPRTVQIDGKTTTQATLGRILQVLWLVPAMDRLWIDNAEARRRYLDRMTLSFIPSHAEVALAYEKAMRERNRLLKDMVRDAGWYGALETQMAQSGAQVTINRTEALRRIAAAQDGAETSFPVAVLALFDSDGGAPCADSAVLERAFSDGRSRDLAAGRTLSGPHRSDLSAVYAAKNLPAAQTSTGEQKALLISLIMANARALKAETGVPPILLLDEVAAHLDADRRVALYDEICALGAQALMTGTGDELFASLGARAQFLEVSETDGHSVVTDRTAP